MSMELNSFKDNLVPGVLLPISPPPLSFIRFSGDDLSEAVGNSINVSLKFSFGPFSKLHAPKWADERLVKEVMSYFFDKRASNEEGAFRSTLSFSDPLEVSTFLKSAVQVYFDSVESSSTLSAFSKQSLSSWKKVFEKFIPPVFPQEGGEEGTYIATTFTTFPGYLRAVRNSNSSFFDLSYEEALKALTLKSFSNNELVDAFWYVFFSTAEKLSSRVSGSYRFSLPFFFKKNSSGRIVSVVIPFSFSLEHSLSPDDSPLVKFSSLSDITQGMNPGNLDEAIFSSFSVIGNWLVFASISYNDFSNAVLKSLKNPVFVHYGSRPDSADLKFDGFVVEDYHLVIDGIRVRFDSVIFSIYAKSVFSDEHIPASLASLPGFRPSNILFRDVSSGFVLYKKSFERDYGKLKFALKQNDESENNKFYPISSYTPPKEERYEKYRLWGKGKLKAGIKKWFNFIFRPKDTYGSFLGLVGRRFGDDIAESPLYESFVRGEDDQKVLDLANAFWGGYEDQKSPHSLAAPEPLLRLLTLSSLGFLTIDHFNYAYSLLSSFCLGDKQKKPPKESLKKRNLFEDDDKGYQLARKHFCSRIFGSSHAYWISSILPDDFLSSLFPNLPWKAKELLDLCLYGNPLSYRSLLFYGNDLYEKLSNKEAYGLLPEDDSERLRLSHLLSDISSTIFGLTTYVRFARTLIEKFGTSFVQLEVNDKYDGYGSSIEAEYFADMFFGMGSGKVFLVNAEVGPGGRILRSDLLQAPPAPSPSLALLVYNDRDKDIFFSVDLGVSWVNFLSYYWVNKLDT